LDFSSKDRNYLANKSQPESRFSLIPFPICYQNVIYTLYSLFFLFFFCRDKMFLRVAMDLERLNRKSCQKGKKQAKLSRKWINKTTDYYQEKTCQKKHRPLGQFSTKRWSLSVSRKKHNNPGNYFKKKTIIITKKKYPFIQKINIYIWLHWFFFRNSYQPRIKMS
jgi:hypothetical protein